MKISKNNLDYDSLYWLTGVKADKQDVRLWKRQIEVKDNSATRTNGHVLLTAKVLSIPDGIYEVEKRNKSLILINPVTDSEFPAWAELFNIDLTTYKNIDIVCSIDGDHFYGLASILRTLPENLSVNWTLYNYITSIEDSFEVDVFTAETVKYSVQPIRFINTTGDRKALLMPCIK